MPSILFLTGDYPEIADDNCLRLANEFQQRGYDVWLGLTDTLILENNEVRIRAFCLQGKLLTGQPYPPVIISPWQPLARYDLCWLLNLGMKDSFLDKIQLIAAAGVTLVNSLTGIMHFKSKYMLASCPDSFKHPPTWSSRDPLFLAEIIRQQGEKWILKPPAGSYGRDVYLIESGDSRIPELLEKMTGPNKSQYVILQRYIEEILDGEKRVLLAAGAPIGQYRRTNQSDYRTNLAQGGQAEKCDLSPEEYSTCEAVGNYLMDHGIHFAGIDLVWPWVIEVNVVNPGGLVTLDELGVGNLTQTVVDRILGKP